MARILSSVVYSLQRHAFAEVIPFSVLQALDFNCRITFQCVDHMPFFRSHPTCGRLQEQTTEQAKLTECATYHGLRLPHKSQGDISAEINDMYFPCRTLPAHPDIVLV